MNFFVSRHWGQNAKREILSEKTFATLVQTKTHRRTISFKQFTNQIGLALRAQTMWGTMRTQRRLKTDLLMKRNWLPYNRVFECMHWTEYNNNTLTWRVLINRITYKLQNKNRISKTNDFNVKALAISGCFNSYKIKEKRYECKERLIKDWWKSRHAFLSCIEFLNFKK